MGRSVTTLIMTIDTIRLAFRSSSFWSYPNHGKLHRGVKSPDSIRKSPAPVHTASNLRTNARFTMSCVVGSDLRIIALNVCLSRWVAEHAPTVSVRFDAL